jgi:hypothetical protein
MPQSCDMGQTALLPLRRKASWGFFRLKNSTASAGFEPANLGTRGCSLSLSCITEYRSWLKLCATRSRVRCRIHPGSLTRSSLYISLLYIEGIYTKIICTMNKCFLKTYFFFVNQIQNEVTRVWIVSRESKCKNTNFTNCKFMNLVGSSLVYSFLHLLCRRKGEDGFIN